MRFGSSARRVLTAAAVSLGLLGTPLAGAQASAISAMSVDGNAITIAFDSAIDGASGLLLDGPRRLAVDIQGLTPGSMTASGGAVLQTRLGMVRPGVGRLVFDLAGTSVVRQASLSDDRRTLTLQLADASPRGFASAARTGRITYAAFLPTEGHGSVTVPLDPPAPYQLPIPAVEGRADKPLVVIDAGHGGHDPGSLSIDGRYREKDATLLIARAIRDELLKSGRVRVAMTRTDDRFLILQERREIARRLHADLFISVHCDSAPGSNASGATVYTLSEVSSDQVAARLAAKENRSDIINGVDLGDTSNDVGNILIDLTQRETMNASSRFADILQRQLTGQGIQFKTTYHRFAGLAVLKAPDVPAVLLESGYITDPGDLRKLFSKGYQHDLAVGVTQAVEAHFARRLGRTDVALND
jgi:N-acetylmuramoyl-L-alanine amidase